MNLANVRVGPKLWVAIVGLLLLMTLTNLGVQRSSHAAWSQSREAMLRLDAKITAAQVMQGAIERSLVLGAAQMASGQVRSVQDFGKRLNAQNRVVEQTMDGVRALLDTDADRQQFAAVQQTFAQIQKRLAQADSQWDAADYQARADFTFGEYAQVGGSYRQHVEAFVALQERQRMAMLQSADAAIQRSMWGGWGLAAALLLMGAALARWLVRSVQQPLQQAVQLTKAIGAGNLQVRAHSVRQDEFGDLMRALGEMASGLRHVVVQVRTSVHEVAGAASEMATGSQDLSVRTEQTAANLEEAAASIEQMSQNMRQANDHMRQTNQIALSAAQAAERGGAVVQDVVESMAQIHTASRKIGDITGVIDSIAFQTNILALNAAVEAARAGEQGRSFAVVASEVRTLAARSAQAAKEIKALIQDSVQRVELGAQQAAQAGDAMQGIVTGVHRVTDLVAELHASAAEQSAGFAQVSQAVSNLDQMTQQNAALVEQASASAHAIHHQSTQLRAAVSVFEVGGDGATATTTVPVSAPSQAPSTLRAPAAAAPMAGHAQPASEATAARAAHRAAVVVAPSAAAAPPAAATPPEPRRAPAKAPARAAAHGDDGDWEIF